MAFNITLEKSRNERNRYHSFRNLVLKYRLYLLVLFVTIVVAFMGYSQLCWAIAIAGGFSTYGYQLYKEIFSISFIVDFGSFDLQDIINDLEN